ncbi:superfamily I DNA and RNA helicases [Candidatus Phytoplasma mali]|uniref:DNA 3'-5' helicase n=1 Tax=Phytoplasma mali (strain AT) TaxID=482235 RepID=B3R0N7_PHYMT|nr:UvrD-helicase domain-containing protein [Candidatus Phytoplasma mali]CAP18621.1 superfamily I DNA and RNA helicases [Candidatus Phytoplasma mali]
MFSDEYLKQLNSKQYQAVTSKDKAVYLVAGAGTGKTKTLTIRIAYLIKYLNINNEKILAITFTNKAASEMKERLVAMKVDIYKSTICTFHSLGNRILKKFIHVLNNNFDSNYSILDIKDSLKIIKKISKDLNIDKEKYKPKELNKYISNIKNKKEKKIFIDNYDNNILKIYNNYQQFLENNNLLDFDDLIIYTYKLLKKHENIKNYFQNKFTHILIDEFQDTDFLQYQILKLLNTKNNYIFAVGDPDQSIYSFRGAEITNNKLFLKDFKAKTLILDENYRSTNNILDKANLLIQNNSFYGFTKKLQSFFGKGHKVFPKMFENDDQEVDFVAEKIKNLIKKEKCNYEDIAILYRLNGLEKKFEKIFLKKNIPYIVFGNINFFNRKEIKDILAYIKILIDPKQDFYLKRIINVPSRKIGKKTISNLEIISKEKNISLFETLILLCKEEKKCNKNLLNFKNLILEMIKKINSNSFLKLENIIDYIDQKVNYSKSINKKKINPENDNLTYIEDLKSFFTKKKDQDKKKTVKQELIDILDQISLNNEVKKDNKNKVTLSTIHKIKGLEFKIVFVVYFEENILPLKNNKYNAPLEEERRIAYVAITRAKERLFLLGAYERNIFGHKTINIKESDFFENMKIFLPRKKSISESKYQFNNNYNFFKIGDKIKHDIFGIGRIITNIENNLLIIAFEPQFGIKKIAYDYAKINLKKIS